MLARKRHLTLHKAPRSLGKMWKGVFSAPRPFHTIRVICGIQECCVAWGGVDDVPEWFCCDPPPNTVHSSTGWPIEPFYALVCVLSGLAYRLLS